MSEGAANVNETEAGGATPALEVRSISKYFGSVNALEDISLAVYAGQVTCVLGDNGAGKSTLIKILSGVHVPDKGEMLFEGEPVSFAGPRDARSRGIATVFQDLATVPLMSVWRNFFLGNEPTHGWGPLQRVDIKGAQRIMRDEMAKMGIDVRDPDQTVGTLSGGERQAMAIARSMGRAVIFITHNPHHAYPVGDRFVLLKRGRMLGSYAKSETTLEQLTTLMAGGAELEELSHELQSAADPEMKEVAKELAAEVQSPA
jgi:simple sugar transport system ATP-binding protein